MLDFYDPIKLRCKYNMKYLFIMGNFVLFTLEYIFCGKKIKLLYLTLDSFMNLKKKLWHNLITLEKVAKWYA